MQWIREEYILSYGYYKTYGNSTATSDFANVLEIFRNFQNREYANAKSTFRIKCMNYHAYENKNYKNAGGLEKNQDFKWWILDQDLDVILSEYHKIINNYHQIKTKNRVLNYEQHRNSNNKIEIDIHQKYKRLAKVSYEAKTIRSYLNEIKCDQYKVPLFQRQFVWSKKQIILFLNALYNGYPFGNITIWFSSDKNDFYRKAFYEKNDFVEKFKKWADTQTNVNNPGLILDGQQRTTSLISLMVQSPTIKKNRDIIFSFKDMKFKSYEAQKDFNYIDAGDLFNDQITSSKIIKKYQLQDKKAIALHITDHLREKILKSQIGVTIVKKSSLDTAIDIFSEMNSTGKKLSLFDIIHAKWLSFKTDYNLETYINDWKAKKTYKPDNLTVAKAIYLIFSKYNIKSSEILKYEVTTENIEEMNSTVKKSLDMAHDFLIKDMLFQPGLIPSTNLFKFLPYVFYKNQNQKLNESIKDALKKYVKDICLKNFYSSSTDQKLQANIEMIDQIFDNYQDNNLQQYMENNMFLKEINKDDLLELKYNENSSFYYYVLNILFRYARGLLDNSQIIAPDKSQKSAKINIYPIVAKSIIFEGKKTMDINYSNSIANLFPVADMDKPKIINNYPSEYYKIFKYSNSSLDQTLTNLSINIDDLLLINKDASLAFVIAFFKKRAQELSCLINSQV